MASMRRLMLDTEPLLLFIAGNLDPTKIGRKRLQKFDREDLARLNEIVGAFPVHWSTPNVLTEASNFLGDEAQFLVEGGLVALAKYIANIEEICVPSISMVEEGLFSQLGLADATCLSLATQGVTVVTVDHRLSGKIQAYGGTVVNLMHFKTPK